MPNNVVLPPTVSPVYYKLEEYVRLTYPRLNPARRYVIFSIAYLLYSEEKKKIIKDDIKLYGADMSSEIIKYPFRRFNNQEKFLELCEQAEEFAKAFLEDDIRSLMISFKPVLNEGFGKHFLYSIFTYVLIAAIPIILAFLHYETAEHWLHSLGIFLVERFP